MSYVSDTLPYSDQQPPNAYRMLVGLLIGFALLSAGNGLFQTLVPLRLLHLGVSTFVIGIVQSCYYVGFIVGAVFSRRLIDRVGQHRTFIAFCAWVAILATAFGLFNSPVALALIRLLTGFAFVGLYASMESWIHVIALNTTRGRMFSVYAVVNYLCMGCGQLFINIGDAGSSEQAALVAVLFSAAVLPVTLCDGWPQKVFDPTLKPMARQTWRAGLKTMVTATPLAIPGALAVGMLYSCFYSMTPLVLAQIGFPVSELSLLMGLASVSVIALQWPVGRLSDHIERPRVIRYVALVSGGLSVTLFAFHDRAIIWGALSVYVAVTFTQYGLVMSHVNDRIGNEHRVVVSALLLILVSVGGMIGAPMVSLLVGSIGPSGLFACNALACSLLVVSAGRALRKQPASLAAEEERQ